MAVVYFNGLVQACSNSIANAVELLQYCAKPSIWYVTRKRVDPVYGIARYMVQLKWYLRVENINSKISIKYFEMYENRQKNISAQCQIHKPTVD